MEIENKLLMQYLSGMGAGLNPDPWVQNLNQMTQQNIAAQSQAGLLDIFKQMLSGQVPEGGKMTTDSKGTKMEIPKSALSSILQGTQPGGVWEGMAPPLGAGRAIEGYTPPIVEPGATPNPFVSSQPEISPSALAGLTPQDISGALSGALSVESFKQKRITDVSDIMYKGALTTESLIRARQALQGKPKFPIMAQGIGYVDIDTWKALPKIDQEYSSYVHVAESLGDDDIMDRKAFAKFFDRTEREQFLRSAMEDPKLMEKAKELARSGATRITIGEKITEKKEMLKLSGQEFFGKGKHIGGMSKYMSSEAVQNRIFMASGDLQAWKKERGTNLDPNTYEAMSYFESEITGRGGKIIDAKWSEDGETFTWTVRWPTGDVEEISHAFRY